MNSRKIALALAAFHSAAAFGQAVCGGVRIDYEASDVSLTIPMAPFSEVQRNFPEAKGITSRTVFATSDRMVEVNRGVGIKTHVTTDFNVPAPGVHFRDKTGREILFAGYEQVPLHLITIDTAREHVSYNSVLGTARRRVRATPDEHLADALQEFEKMNVAVGEREYGGVKCLQKRVPAAGAQSETCVRNYFGWPIALYMQFHIPDIGMQWYRATRVRENACMQASEWALPSGTRIIDATVQEPAEADLEDDDSEE